MPKKEVDSIVQEFPSEWKVLVVDDQMLAKDLQAEQW